jgi:PAS domain S-box-containing protein
MPDEFFDHQEKYSMQVLLVDDDPDSAEKTAQLLQRLDIQQSIQCKIVELLSDALTEISQAHYDIIILDIGVSDMPSPTAIHSLRDAFAYAPIIATSKFDDPELAATWVGEGADDCLYMGVMNEKMLSRVVQYAIMRSKTYSELHERSRTHHILNSLLSLSLQEMPIEQLLQECLEVFLSAPFAEMLHQGAIFVNENGSQELKMLAHVNLDQRTVDLCGKVAFGHCLCGRAARSGEIQFSDCVDHRHENLVDGMQPHGHYTVPILSKGKVLGVLVLYLEQGHVRRREEEAFLRGVSDTLAGIIERAYTREQLARANEQNSRLLSSLTSILIGVDNQDRITHWNEAAERTFGVTAEQALGQAIVSRKIGLDWAMVSSNIPRNPNDYKQTNRFEVRYQPRNGTHRLLSICATPFLGERGGCDGYLLIADDVTEQKQLDSEMQQLQKLQSIGQLAAGIAHEINTPIQYVGDNVRFIRGAVEDIFDILKEERAVDEAARTGRVTPELIAKLDNKIEAADLEYLETEVPNAIKQTLDGVDRVATIVRAMKEFSHPGSKDKTPTDINRAIDSAVTVTRNVWKYHAEMQLELAPSLPQVHCIPGPINEVLLNVIVNAAHAIVDKVDDSGEKGLIHIKTGLEDNRVVIRIGDNGTGIPEDAREHVFDPFFTTKEVGHGTGQGLSLSHRIIVEQHDGELGFETEMGVGTTFVIKLPL